MSATAPVGEPSVLATVGRKRVVLALTDQGGALRPETIRSYDAEATSGVSDALSTFRRDLALPVLPKQSAIAVAGLARGDAISITRTRWIISRPGIEAMLGRPPLVLNDFAAEAWALYSADVRPAETFNGVAHPSLRKPGCYLLLGITSGLGAAVLRRDESGLVTVLPTEAGHGGFVAGTEELARLADDLYPGKHPVIAEDIVSAPGLLAIYELVARRRGFSSRAHTPEEVTRGIALDPIAREACELLCKAFWAQAGSLVQVFGAWDGVLLTGKVAQALRQFLRRPDTQSLFAGVSKYHRLLSGVPRGYAALEHSELVGLAEALRHHGHKAGAGPAA
jgi:glucokinase